LKEGFAVKIKDLVKVYKLGSVEIQALRGLNLSVKHGEFVAIIGPSGSGKSTLLNIIGGIDRATAGSVEVMNIDLTHLNSTQIIEFRREKVGYLVQGANLVPILTAAENIDLPMTALGVKKAERKRRLKEIVDIMGLRNITNRMPKEISGGEQQRVALATALANNPPLIIVDEPTGDLDTKNALIIIDYLVKASHELGRTIIMTTHDPRVAKSADRILRMQDGVITVDVEPSVGVPRGDDTYADYIKERISEIERDLGQLTEQFKNGRMDSETYLKRHKSLKDSHDVLSEELQRLGFIK